MVNISNVTLRALIMTMAMLIMVIITMVAIFPFWIMTEQGALFIFPMSFLFMGLLWYVISNISMVSIEIGSIEAPHPIKWTKDVKDWCAEFYAQVNKDWEG